MANNTQSAPVSIDNIGEVKISALNAPGKKYIFNIPDYQRGYRWCESDVKTLLDDIDTAIRNKEDYCIQPVVTLKTANGEYEVIDGQQRLTTIYLVWKIVSEHLDPDEKPQFDIKYATKDVDPNLLGSISQNTQVKDDKIDEFHITDAARVINAWFENKFNNNPGAGSINKIKRDFCYAMWDTVFFISYPLPKGADPKLTFEKINTGRIPLTNSELIKALLMDAGSASVDAQAERRRLEISTLWDKIEQGLWDDSFWYFLNNENPENKDIRQTRIDFLFRIMADEYLRRDPELNGLGFELEDDYFAFKVYFEKQRNWDEKNQGKKFGDAMWDDIEKLYSEFRSWYDDLEKYHIIGYLSEIGVKPSAIMDKLLPLTTAGSQRERLPRDKVIPTLIGMVKEQLRHKRYADKNGRINWDDKHYNTHKEQLRDLFLLFNIATLSNYSANAKQNAAANAGDIVESIVAANQNTGDYRFPFNKYKKEKWDIEHIHARADKLPDKNEDVLKYLLLLEEYYKEMAGAAATTHKTNLEMLSKDAVKLISEFIKDNTVIDKRTKPEGEIKPKEPTFRKNANKLYEHDLPPVLDRIEQDEKIADPNALGNLTLLDSGTNRSYKNSTFLEKCKIIKENDSNGKFIPPCTKNAFLKYYSDKTIWPFWSGGDDKHPGDIEKHEEAIKSTVNKFLERAI